MSAIPSSEAVAAPPVSDADFKAALSRFVSGVTVVTVGEGDEVHGMTVSAFMSVSLAPRLVAVAIGRSSRMAPRIELAGRFGLTILDSTQGEEAMRFAGRPPAAPPRFVDLAGVGVLAEGRAALSLDRHAIHDGGDHLLVVGAVRAVRLCARLHPPLAWLGRGFHSVTPRLIAAHDDLLSPAYDPLATSWG
jgi:flavin reductase (DIM6/NTAB) family NADH-FMN oxidoreductase RutF